METKYKLCVILLACAFLSLAAAAAPKVIPVTTKSNEALREFTTGRDLYEQLRTREAIPYFERAIAKDGEFALAYYYLAQCATSNRMFMDNLEKAVSNAGKVSDGERDVIESLQARVNGNTDKEIDLLREAITRYPDDTRAHMALGAVLMVHEYTSQGIKECTTAIRLDPKYAPAHNILGYLYSAQGDYSKAESEFKTYTDLVPNEPNPYDSYAELLLKEGKFDESIAMYEKALKIDPHFYSSIIGIANDHALAGRPEEARIRLQKMFDSAPDDGARRQALTGMAMVALIEGNYDLALTNIHKRHDIAVKDNDDIAIAEDLTTLGTILLEASGTDVAKGTFLKSRTAVPAKVDEAGGYLEQASTIVSKSTLPKDIKGYAQMQVLFSMVEAALHNNDIPTAKSKAAEFRTKAMAGNNVDLKRRSHALFGLIAMAEGRYPDALTELNQADLQNPRTLLRLAEVNQALGNTEKARELRNRVAHFNENTMDFALVRAEALE